jgi:predicted PurR-regulated permease PerM
MVVLKKVKSATLVEVIVATVLIVIIFIIASLVLNNLVLNTVSKNAHPVENRLNELEYQIQNGLLKIPYQENFKGWAITIQIKKTASNEMLSILATNEKNTKEVLRQRIYAKK